MAVVGEEQICDIELDKSTIIRFAGTEHPPANLRVFWKLADESLVVNQEAEQQVGSTLRFGTFIISCVVKRISSKCPVAAYEEILSNLLPRFPLTIPVSTESVLGRKRRGLNLPYKLVTSSQFSGLVEGRRKAIEVGQTSSTKI